MARQKALITGASRGFGLAVARALAREGWILIINARGEEALETARAELAQYTEITAIPGDVTEPAHREALADAAAEVGGLDVVINNAGILGPSPQPELLKYPLDVLDKVYHANVIAPLGVLQAVRPHLKPGARLINITSDAGVEAYAGWGGYGSSKAALEQLSAVMAQENPQLKVYWVDPGDMRTQMHQDAFPGEDISDRPLPEDSVPGLLRLLKGDYASGRYNVHHIDAPAKQVRELRLVLTVRDLDKALRFYRDGLQLPVSEQWQTEDGQGHGYLLEAGRATIELFDEPYAASIDQIETGSRTAGPVRLAFEVGSIADASTDLNGTEELSGIVTVPWGHRNQRLVDPDGLQVTLFEVVEPTVEAEEIP